MKMTLISYKNTRINNEYCTLTKFKQDDSFVYLKVKGTYYLDPSHPKCNIDLFLDELVNARYEHFKKDEKKKV